IQEGVRLIRGAGPWQGASPGVIAYASRMRPSRLSLIAIACFCLSAPARAETGRDAWLRYPRITDATVVAQYAALPSAVVLLGVSPVLQWSRDELSRGLGSMLGRTIAKAGSVGTSDAIVLGTVKDLRAAASDLSFTGLDTPGAFYLRTMTRGRQHLLVV